MNQKFEKEKGGNTQVKNSESGIDRKARKPGSQRAFHSVQRSFGGFEILSGLCKMLFGRFEMLCGRCEAPRLPGLLWNQGCIKFYILSNKLGK